MKVCLHCKDLWEPAEAPYCGNCSYPSAIEVREEKNSEKESIHLTELKKARELIVKLLINMDLVLESTDQLQRDHDFDDALQEACFMVNRIDQVISQAP